MSVSKTSHSHGLGRGFEALLPQNFDATLLVSEADRIQKIGTDDVIPNSQQPRRHFDETALRELAGSIKQYGVLQPLVVTPKIEGKYMIIAGERRWRAALLAGLKTIPVIVRSSEELERLEIALVENVQRIDLSPLEQAASIERLHQQFNMGYEVISKRLGKAVSTVNNIVRLLQLPENAQKALHDKHITEGHARSILALKDYPKEQQELLNLIMEHGWSVRQAERFVITLKAGAPNTTTARRQMRSETNETKRLGKKLGTQVSIRRTAHGGKLEISFNSPKELDRIIQTLL